MSKRINPKKGDIVHIILYDHADFTNEQILGDENEVLEFEVFGRLIKTTTLDYRVAKWITPGVDVDHNAEYYSILKSAVKYIKVLR